MSGHRHMDQALSIAARAARDVQLAPVAARASKRAFVPKVARWPVASNTLSLSASAQSGASKSHPLSERAKATCNRMQGEQRVAGRRRNSSGALNSLDLAPDCQRRANAPDLLETRLSKPEVTHHAR